MQQKRKRKNKIKKGSTFDCSIGVLGSGLGGERAAGFGERMRRAWRWQDGNSGAEGGGHGHG